MHLVTPNDVREGDVVFVKDHGPMRRIAKVTKVVPNPKGDGGVHSILTDLALDIRIGRTTHPTVLILVRRKTSGKWANNLCRKKHSSPSYAVYRP